MWVKGHMGSPCEILFNTKALTTRVAWYSVFILCNRKTIYNVGMCLLIVSAKSLSKSATCAAHLLSVRPSWLGFCHRIISVIMCVFISPNQEWLTISHLLKIPIRVLSMCRHPLWSFVRMSGSELICINSLFRR